MLPSPASGRPFVLIDDAGPGGEALLFTNPREMVRADTPEQLPVALARLREALAQGLHAAGYLAYEAALAFEPRWPGLLPAMPAPLLWFGLFDAPARHEGEALSHMLPEAGRATIGRPTPMVDLTWHAQALGRALDFIGAGDVYQINLTFPCAVPWSGDPLGLYAGLRRRGGARYGGVVATGERLLLSASPELFFELRDGHLSARPMKGTAARLHDAARDRVAAAGLAASAKDRAENLMITDLLRNDLSRVAVAGSVRVPELFAIETYPTVHQMTSSVTVRLRDGLDPIDVLAAAFPCGSVTGAPKLRAAAIIAELETGPRGAYTGAIGWMRADAARFNVAIRTLEIDGSGDARLGIGSGIVADSKAADEWCECLAKAAFVTDSY